MLVAEDNLQHCQVIAHPHHEDSCVQTVEDRFHPGLINVELLADAHLYLDRFSRYSIFIQFDASEATDWS